MRPPPRNPPDPDDGARVAGELLARVAGGDREALAELYDRFAKPLFSIAVAVTRDPAAAEDVVQIAMTRVWQRARSYQAASGRPTTWIITIARNAALDHLRAVRRRANTLEAAAQEASAAPAPAAQPEAAAARNETARIVHSALARLPRQQGEAIALAFLRGMSQTEIARHLGVPLGTVKSRIRRAMHTLRVDLADQLGLTDPPDET